MRPRTHVVHDVVLHDALQSNRTHDDHVIVMTQRGFTRVLTEYVTHYLCSRTHLALGKDTPMTRPIRPPPAGRIVAIPEVGGLHHRYDRVAA